MTARYLVRFDDICPGMNWPMWRRIEAILDGAGVKPLLAVVPDNLDEKLNVGPLEADFWPRVRKWQARGYAIGLHGYQHRYVTDEAGLVGLNARSEFAGLSAAEQAEKLERALAIFRRESVRPDLWIAPAHSFDAATLDALRRLGIDALSDGFFLGPHRDAGGMLWLPQQLWSFRYRPFGLWTVCYHHNGWTDADLDRFERDVTRYRDHITSFAEVKSGAVRDKAFHDDWVSRLLLGTIRSKQWLRALLK